MFDSLVLKEKMVRPALFMAPMAGITHSAFRRLVADFGGYGALFTEMLSGHALLQDNICRSPFTKRRECEGLVVYQLMLRGNESLESVIERLREVKPEGIDLNLGCPAPKVCKSGAGVSLFGDLDRLSCVLDAIRSSWDGILTVKCRLGQNPEIWRKSFEKRLRTFERFGVDAIHVHPRFFDEKLKRCARLHLLRWIASCTKIPIIANGDITPDVLMKDEELLSSGVQGVMIGRMAAVKPWVFQECAGQKPEIDYAQVWERLYQYVMEDFSPERAIGRIKAFSEYFARNFFYGHQFFKAVRNTATLQDTYESAMRFLHAGPKIVAKPSVAGI